MTSEHEPLPNRTPSDGINKAKSNGQAIVAKSSTEAELICVDTASMELELVLHKAVELKMTQPPAVLQQDNQATIRLILNGASLSSRTKHIKVRYFSIVEKIHQYLMTVQWTKSADMESDMLTKYVNHKLLVTHRATLLGKSYTVI